MTSVLFDRNFKKSKKEKKSQGGCWIEGTSGCIKNTRNVIDFTMNNDNTTNHLSKLILNVKIIFYFIKKSLMLLSIFLFWSLIIIIFILIILLFYNYCKINNNITEKNSIYMHILLYTPKVATQFSPEMHDKFQVDIHILYSLIYLRLNWELSRCNKDVYMRYPESL